MTMRYPGCSVIAITETWLKSTIDATIVRELTPKGYSHKPLSRSSRKGGGVALLYKSTIDIKKPVHNVYRTFEHIEYMRTDTSSIGLRLIVIYRPPPSQKNRLTFFEEWTSFVDGLVITPGKFIIMGDINFHLDDTSDCNASRFRASIKSTGLIMHVREPTHRNGHTLDVLLTRENDEQLVGNILVKDLGVSDHLAITFTIDVVRPGCCRKKVSFRKLHDINISDFQEEMNVPFRTPLNC